MEQAPHDWFDICQRLHAAEHDNKLVATQSGGCIAFTNGVAQTVSQRLQQPVSGIVSVGIVNSLETIQIQIYYGEFIAEPLCVGHCLMQAVCKQQAIGEPGEGVKMGDFFHLRLMVFQVRDVGGNAQYANNLRRVVIIINGRLDLQIDEALPVFKGHVDFFPGLFSRQHSLVNLFDMSTGCCREKLFIPGAHQSLCLNPEQLQHRAIGITVATLCVLDVDIGFNMIQSRSEMLSICVGPAQCQFHFLARGEIRHAANHASGLVVGTTADNSTPIQNPLVVAVFTSQAELIVVGLGLSIQISLQHSFGVEQIFRVDARFPFMQGI